jgi:hypothetical protein
MSKHAKNSPSLQLLESPRSIPIEIPLPMLAALEGVENAFFELCVAAGRQVLDVMMEQDREALWVRSGDGTRLVRPDEGEAH